MFESVDELKSYVSETYPEVSDSRIDNEHWDLLCTKCRITRGFQVVRRAVSGERGMYGGFDKDLRAPVTYLFRCPVCSAFKQWIVYEFEFRSESGTWSPTAYFRVTSVPSEGIEEISEIPNDPPSLRAAYREAVRAMDANANLAAAAMFRRALQVITRDLLGAKPGNLASELKAVVGKTYNGGVVTSSFADVAYIIKEAGNQGAHPDEDPDLLTFTAQDAEDLQRVFMELVSELFIVPAAVQKAKRDFMARRKIMPQGSTSP